MKVHWSWYLLAVLLAVLVVGAAAVVWIGVQVDPCCGNPVGLA